MNLSLRLIALAVFLSALTSFRVQAQENTSSQSNSASGADTDSDAALLDFSLEQLLDIPVTVASGSVNRTAADSPGIVTVITARDIERLGARDLVDVLRTVPGLEPEYYISGHIGLGVRGNWAHEGKVLFLIDGIEYNEEFYGAFNLSQRVPLVLIDRIEIIRGPGSVMYGGAAELAVISIHTKRPTEKNSVLLNSNAGVMFNDGEAALETVGGTAYYGGLYDHLSFDMSVSGRTGHASNTEVTDPYGGTFETGNDQTSDLFFSSNFKIYDMKLQLMMEQYQVDYTYTDAYTWPNPAVSDYHTDHYDVLARAEYDIAATDKLRITPGLQYKRTHPWYHPDVVDDEGNHIPSWESSQRNEKFSADMDLSWNIVPQFNLSTGVVYDYTKNLDQLADDPSNYQNVAVYLQGIGTSRIIDYAAGVRFNYHDQFGPSVVPRLALTKKFLEHYHVKLLWAMAYKAPTVANMIYTPEIDPEKTNSLELEVGARIKEVWMLTGNVFFNQMKDVIVYTYIDGEVDDYLNKGETSTIGTEVTSKVIAGIAEFDLSYSFYHILENTVEDYTVPGNDAVTLGFAPHKITASLSINPFDQFYITPAFVFLAPRHAIKTVEYDEDGNASNVYSEQDAEALLDLTIVYKNLLSEGLDLSLSSHNLLGEHAVYTGTTFNSEAPFPGPGRDIMLQLTWHNF